MVSPSSRNENSEALKALQQLVVRHCEQTFEKIFKEPFPDGWSADWLARFNSYLEQERDARELVSGISRNQQGLAAHAERIHKFLARNGVDPQEYDFNHDFGARMALTGAARWLLDSWGDIQAASAGSSGPVAEMKRYYERFGPLPAASWTGFMLAYFSRLPARIAADGELLWGDRPDRDVPLSDSELAVLSILIFRFHHPEVSVPVVTWADVAVQSAPVSEILERRRRQVARARRDLQKGMPTTGYEGPDLASVPKSAAHGRSTPAVPWPRPWKPISLDAYVDEVLSKTS